LVKAVPFTQPATIEDLNLIQEELKLHPKESRPIELYSLGAELRLQEAIKQHNKTNPINKITLIDIRYEEGIVQHQPAELDATLEREGNEVIVTLTNYISPTLQQKLFKEGLSSGNALDDFRRQLDFVSIDPNYDGSIFKPTVQDASMKKTELIVSKYRFTNSAVGNNIAVKTIDVLGEEVLKVLEV
jgi:hypothetical protein